MQETEKRHGTYEPTAPQHHWSGWYAAYVIARERGRTPDDAATDATRHIEGALDASHRPFLRRRALLAEVAGRLGLAVTLGPVARLDCSNDR